MVRMAGVGKERGKSTAEQCSGRTVFSERATSATSRARTLLCATVIAPLRTPVPTALGPAADLAASDSTARHSDRHLAWRLTPSPSANRLSATSVGLVIRGICHD
jgi:hypothetical protein